MNSKITTQPLRVEPFSEDFTGKLSWGVLGNLLLRAANIHASQHRFGYDNVLENKHAWVLSRLVVEMEALPVSGEDFDVSTWVTGVFRQFTDRLYAVTGAANRVYGYAHSVWALIDMESRQPVNLEQLPEGGFSDAFVEKSIPIPGPGRIRVKSQTPCRVLTTYYSDLDINGHVNSIRYIQMMLDLFPKETFEHQRVKRIDVAYCAESYCGETLCFFSEEKAAGVCAVEIRKDDGTVVVRGEITFAD